MKRIRVDDHLWLVISFIILVSVVVFLSYDVDRQLKAADEVRCTNAEIQLNVAALNLTVTESLATLDASDEANEVIGQAILDTTIELSNAALELDDVCPTVLVDEERAELESTVKLLEDQLDGITQTPEPNNG